MKNLSTAVLSGGLRCLCIVLCMLLLLPASAQPSADSGRKIRVSGRVVDSKGFVIAGATVLGPLLQGLAKPVMDLSRASTVDTIVDTIVICCCDA